MAFVVFLMKNLFEMANNKMRYAKIPITPNFKVSKIKKSKLELATLKSIKAFNPQDSKPKICVGATIKETNAKTIIIENNNVNNGSNRILVIKPTKDKYPKYFAINGNVAICVAVVSARIDNSLFGVFVFIVRAFVNSIMPNIQAKLKQNPTVNMSNGLNSKIIMPLNPSVFSASGLCVVSRDK